MKISFSKIQEWKYLVPLLFLLIIISRFLFLDADPSFVKRVSDISDEAVWGLDARTLALFDSWGRSEVHFGLDSAPLYTLLLKFIFEKLWISTFTLRLLAAISGCITAILLYLFVKKLTTRKQALLALALYGFGEAPFVYNRLGHIESSLTLFLFSMFIFWYLAEKHKSFFYISGLCYGTAFLIKFTALFFAPALFGYWLYEYLHQRWQWKNFFLFVLGAATPVMIYLTTFLIPNWNKLARSMLAHGNNNFFGAEFLQNSLKILGNNIFGLITVYLAFFLLVVYFLHKLSLLKKWTLTEIVEAMSPLEAISLCWILLGIIGALLSDLSDRRLTILFVPASILISHLISNWKDFSLKELSKNISAREFLFTHQRKEFFPSLFFFAPLFLPIFSLPYIHLRLLGENTLFFKYGSILLLFTFLLTVIFLYAINTRVVSPEKRKKLFKILLFQFLFFVLFDPFTVLLRHYTRHISIITSLMNYEVLSLAGLTFFFFIFCAGLTLFLYGKEEVIIKRKVITKTTVMYFFISVLIISEALFFPKFTVKEGTQLLQQTTEQDQIIFGEAMGLLYGTTHEFMYYSSPNNVKFSHLNKELFSLKPKYFVYARSFDGKDTVSSDNWLIFQEIKKNYRTQAHAEIKLYPYPFSDKYKIELEVYEIEYLEEE